MFKHLKEAKLSYLSHFKQAMGYFFIIQKAAFCVFMHAFWPDLFPTKASTIIKDLSDHFEQKSND